MTADRPLADAIAALGRALARLPAPHMIIGGIAVIARGVPRLTDDVDATVWGEGLDAEDILRALAAEGIAPRIPDAVEFARQRQVLLLRHGASGTPMEVSLAWLPFEREALACAEPLDLAGARLPVARAEDLCVYKLVAWRDQDRADVEALLRLHGARMDLGRVRRIVAEFALALETPERVAEFERLVQRATRP